MVCVFISVMYVFNGYPEVLLLKFDDDDDIGYVIKLIHWHKT